MPDEVIVEAAKGSREVIITHDLDYRHLLAFSGVVHPAGGYEVELVPLTGGPLAVVSLQTSQVRPIGAGEMAHARHVAA